MNLSNDYTDFGLAAQAKYHAAAMAQVEAQNVRATPAEPQPPSVVSDIFGRLARLDATLGEIDGEVCSVNDRLFGPSPTCAGSANGAGNVLGGQYGELLLSLDRLIERASTILGVSRNLNGRI